MIDKILILIILTGIITIWSCRTEIPFDPGSMEPEVIDTMPGNPVDSFTNPIDTQTMNPPDTLSEPCDTGIVYFDSQILPILQGNCAFSGCHDPVTAQHDLVLNSYESIMAHDDVIVPFDLDKSELYEKITEDDVEDRMPPPPNAPLTQQQIELIRKWILQGAENITCENMGTGCDTAMVSFSTDVLPVMNTYCVTCHGNTNPNAGIMLTNYNGVSGAASSGKLLGVISWANGFLRMPLGGNQLPECDINVIAAWINQGAQDN